MISTARSGSRDVTSDSASAERYTSVSPYDATRTTAFWFGSSLGVPGVGRPQHVEDEPADAEGRPCSDDLDPHVARSRGPERLLALGPGRSEARLEHLPHAEPPDHVRRTAHVITLGVGHDDRGERADAHSRELARDVRLRRPLVDEDARARRLQQRRIALADVEEGHAEPCGRVPLGRAAGSRSTPVRRARRRPRRLRRARVSAEGCARAASPPEPRTIPRPASALSASAVRVPICAPGRSATTRATSSSQAAAQPASAAKTGCSGRRAGSTTAARSPRPSTSGAAANASTFARDRVERGVAEVQQDDRCGRETARECDGERIGHARRQRIAVERCPHARDGEEDRGDRGERELEARLQRRRRHPRHEHERPDRQEVPPVARPGGEPGERRQRARNARAHDRRLPADCEDVDGDRDEDRELAPCPP